MATNGAAMNSQAWPSKGLIMSSVPSLTRKASQSDSHTKITSAMICSILLYLRGIPRSLIRTLSNIRPLTPLHTFFDCPFSSDRQPYQVGKEGLLLIDMKLYSKNRHR